MKIGVFDSGRGGEFIAIGLKELLPDHEFTVVNDRENVPYGSRDDADIKDLTAKAIQPLLNAECPIIVIACNTATMAAISALRNLYPSVHFVGTEPMIKPAASLSKSHHATVLATPLTLKSQRYQHLISKYGSDLTIDQPNASGWAAAIEAGRPEIISFSEVSQSVANGSDTIILACTHYLVLKDTLHMLFPHVTILEPTEPIAKQITRLIEQVEAAA